MVTFHKQGVPVVDNLLTAMHQLSVGLNNWATSAVFGDTRVLGANTVNALRVSFNRTKVDRYNAPTVEPSDLGIKAFSYEPHRMNIDVAGGFVAGHRAPATASPIPMPTRSATISRSCAAGISSGSARRSRSGARTLRRARGAAGNGISTAR